MRTILACIGTFILCIVLMSMWSAGGSQVAQPPTRWEYAMLRQSANGQVDVTTPQGYTDGNSWADLIKNYTHHDLPLAGPRDMVDALGAEGWELVSVTITPTPSGSMWFKRPVIK